MSVMPSVTALHYKTCVTIADRPMWATRRERYEERHQRDRAHDQKTPERYATVQTSRD